MTQAVPVPLSGGDSSASAVYEWCPKHDWLAAAGGASPNVAHLWNLEAEKSQFRVRSPAARTPLALVPMAAVWPL